MNARTHIEKRICKARRSLYRYSSAGIHYPGLASSVKIHVWQTVGGPSLTYGMGCINVKRMLVGKLESTQGTAIKSLMGLSKRSHSTSLLSALNVPCIRDIIDRDTLSLARRIHTVPSPARTLNTYRAYAV